MKIGIITVADSANFGSFLQGFALKNILEGLGYEVRFIRTRDEEYVKRIYYNWKPGPRDLVHPLRFLRKNINGYKKHRKFTADHQFLKMCLPGEEDNLDCVILGSDEIWNVRSEVFRSPVFYGRDRARIIAYAISAGSAVYSDFLYYPEILQWVHELEDIYVRDENTRDIVEKIIGKRVGLVCDPTFLTDDKSFFKEFSDSYLEKHRYILVYIYPNALTKEIIKEVKKFSKRKCLKLVSAGFYNYWCDYNVVCSPLEFCAVIKHAQYVITGTFHGSIFSILNEKQFVGIAMSEKVKDLLKRYDLESRLIQAGEITAEKLDRLSDREIDYQGVGRKIEQIREYSLEQLKEVIAKYADRDL